MAVPEQMLLISVHAAGPPVAALSASLCCRQGFAIVMMGTASQVVSCTAADKPEVGGPAFQQQSIEILWLAGQNCLHAAAVVECQQHTRKVRQQPSLARCKSLRVQA
jgi:hypothetical protein